MLPPDPLIVAPARATPGAWYVLCNSMCVVCIPSAMFAQLLKQAVRAAALRAAASFGGWAAPAAASAAPCGAWKQTWELSHKDHRP